MAASAAPGRDAPECPTPAPDKNGNVQLRHLENPMEAPFILHMLSPLRHVSPFDVNMALDAGFNAVVPYINVEEREVKGLVQDAIFSRGPKGAKRTAIFIGGQERDPRSRHARGGASCDGAALRRLRLRRSRGLLHDGGRDGRVRREDAEGRSPRRRCAIAGWRSSARPASSASPPPSSRRRKARGSSSSATTASSA